MQLIVISLLISGGVWAGPIGMTVDGSSVSSDAEPVIINNQILVPLRAISDRLGASIEYNPVSHTITASRGNRMVDLAVHSTVALVNGETRYLEVAPTVIHGRVMVPLRFLVESLGVEAKWSADGQELAILSRTGGVDSDTTTPEIDSVTTNAGGLLGTGDRLTVEMTGAPGGTASFDIDDATRGIPMMETSPGHYLGAYVIPPGLEIQNGKIVGHLSIGGEASLAASPDPVDILGKLTAEPEIQLRPQPDTVIRSTKPFVSAYFSHPIDPDVLRIFVDGNDVTSSTEIDDHDVQWIPMNELNPGKHQVTVSGSTRQGATFTKIWSFYVSP